ncbi:MAG TPA: FtsX-like permease family protein [Steroidobacteraceae bacterium]|jgi:putative ABC transport system permease protein|nr:FtsX-like permease family protein [Steroidobacteraceae bacterium]
MEILPILRTLRRNKVGAALIALQIAVTLAIISNCLSIILQRVQWMHRPSGIDEANIFALYNTWAEDPPDLKARIEADLAALRALPGVIDAEAMNNTPLALAGAEWHWPLAKHADHEFTAWSAIYTVDDHGLATYGLNLIAGRWFTASEVGEIRNNEVKFPPSVVITKSIAKALFPEGNALGQTLYFQHTGSTRVVGIVEKMQRPSDGPSSGNPWAEYSVLIPFQLVNNGLMYVVRTSPGQQAAVMRATPATLMELSRERIIQSLLSFAEIRHQAHRSNRATIIMLGTLSALLLAITAFGVVGLTMYWVGQRRRHIGMRRALGARRVDILRYYQTENLLIATTGCVMGVVLGLSGNTWLAAKLEIQRMSLSYACIGALIVLALCQLAVLWPALRAASVPPAIATRGL